jgi:hypothetical protein
MEGLSMYMLENSCPEELLFLSAIRAVEKEIAKNQWSRAQDIAIGWARVICEKWGLQETLVWKIFKRSLAARWFGKVECKRFWPRWSVKEVIEYAKKFHGQSVRLSLFPEKIACHATSFILPEDRMNQWSKIIGQLDNSVAIEIFPESSTKTSVCFRRSSTLLSEEVIYEAGEGQASFVFEQEQGKHSTVVAWKPRAKFKYIRKTGEEGDCSIIEEKLRALIKKHEKSLAMKSFCICSALGINYLHIEGYFDPLKKDSIHIVDLDLPFDLVFMKPLDTTCLGYRTLGNSSSVM